MTVHEMTVDEMTVDETTVDETTVDETTVDETTVDEMTVDETGVDRSRQTRIFSCLCSLPSSLTSYPAHMRRGKPTNPVCAFTLTTP